MSDEPVVTRLVSLVRALFPEDWQDHAGKSFRAGTLAISEFAGEHSLRPADVLNEGVELARNKLTGLAIQEHAAAQKNYAEAAKAFTDSEDKKIETELKRRSIETELDRKQ